MDKVLKLFIYQDGEEDKPFPSLEKQAILTSFQYNSKRMGGAPTISATLMHEQCLDKLWDYKVYATFNGEKYFIKNIPSSSYSNTSVMYKHELELVSERVLLDNVYVYDAVSPLASYDKPVSNSTKFTFFGNIHEFASRLNYSLKYRNIGYSVVVDEGISSESKVVSFEDTTFSNAIQESYKTYEIPYYFVGNVIHFGFTDNAIPSVFKYGIKDSLLSIQKTNANYKIVTRITGVGSEDNIPYYYPNTSEKGEVSLLYNGSSTSNVYVSNQSKFENFKLSDKLIYKHLEQRETELLSGFSIVYFVDISDDNDTTSVFEFGLESTFTMPSTSTINVEVNILNNKLTDISIKDYDGREQLYRSTDTEKNDISVKLTPGTYTLYLMAKLYVKDGVVILSKEDAEYFINDNVSAKATYTFAADDYWSNNGVIVRLEDYGLAVSNDFIPQNDDYITLRQDSYMQPSKYLLPPIYRYSGGTESFYTAQNNTYINPDTGAYYKFNNEFVSNNPREHVVSFDHIKPTIKGMHNASYQPMDEFIEFAYDLNDNDDKYAESGEYVHPYFFAKLPKFDGEYGFNLFDHAIDEGEMSISMTSGSCGACEFVIGVDESTKKNIVQIDEYGNLLRDKDGNIRFGSPQPKQNDTQNNEVWIALKKDINTFGVVMPNVSRSYKPSSNDTFVILHIDLPNAYILSAENKLKEELIKYMSLNNDEKFTFSISFSRIYFAENPQMLKDLNENARIQLEYDGKIYQLYISSYSYSMSGEDSLPEVKVELSDTLTISQNSLQQSIDKVESDIMSSVGSIDWLKHGLAYFIRKDMDDGTKNSLSIGRNLSVGNSMSVENSLIAGGDTTLKKDLYVNGLLSLFKGAASNNFLSGFLGSGFELRKNEANGRWRLEVDELMVRMIASFFELVIHKIRHVGGSIILSPASMECVKVEDMGNVYRCYFKATDGEKTVNNEFVVGDQARCQSFNLKQEGGITKTTFYWRLVTAIGDDWIELSKSDCADGSGTPEAGDDIVQLGNRNDTSRQNAIILDTAGSDSPSLKQYALIDSYSVTGKEVTVFSPLENKIKGRFINVAGEDINSSIIDFKEQIEAIKARNDRELTLWFYDYTPTLDNPPASEWSDEEKNLHLEDLFYNRVDGLAYRFTVNESGVYSWEVITDQDTIRALEKANQAQDTADGKRRTFVSTPTDSDEYDVGDIWVNATYGDLYRNDNLVCIQSKKAGETFDISHWQASSNATTSYIENMGNEIRQVVSDNKAAADLAISEAKSEANAALEEARSAYSKAEEASNAASVNATAIVQGKEAISALAGKFTFNEKGEVVNVDKSGLLLTEAAAALYTKKETTNALGERVTIAEAKIETSVKKDSNGKIESGVSISADQITMTGDVTFASKSELGDLAYKNMVGQDMLDETIISGGYIKTSMIDTENIVVKNLMAVSENGNVTCKIDGNTGKLEATGANIEGYIGPFQADGNGLYSDTIIISDQHNYISIAPRENRSITIGGNSIIHARDTLLSQNVGDKKTLCELDCGGFSETESGDNNIAISIKHGAVQGLRRRIRHSSSSIAYDNLDNILVFTHTTGTAKAFNYSDTIIAHGQELWVYSINGQTVTFQWGSTYNYTINDNKCHIFIYDMFLNTWLHSSMN